MPKDMENTAPEQLRDAIQSLTPRELLRLRRYAEFAILKLGHGSAPETADDLIQETVLRILKSERLWNPADVSFVAFFIGCMKSIAWSWHKRMQPIALEDLEIVAPGENARILRLGLADKTNIESDLHTKRETERLIQIFEDDALATNVIRLWIEGKRRRQVIKELDIKDLDYSTVVKRISRKIHREAIIGGHS